MKNEKLVDNLCEIQESSSKQTTTEKNKKNLIPFMLESIIKGLWHGEKKFNYAYTKIY